MAKSERRRSHRHPVQNVKGTLHASASVRILNLSLTGMAVEADAPLRVGKKYSVTLQAGEGSQLELPGSVVWCHLRGRRAREGAEPVTVYAAGIAFEETLTERASALLRFLEKSAVIDVHTRVCGRFTLLDARSAALRASHDFEVRTISNSGMLLESEFSAPVDTTIEIELTLDGVPVRADGRVAFLGESALVDKRRVVQLGVEFMEMDGRARAAVERFIGGLLS